MAKIKTKVSNVKFKTTGDVKVTPRKEFERLEKEKKVKDEPKNK
jgi:hypothetical protein